MNRPYIKRLIANLRIAENKVRRLESEVEHLRGKVKRQDAYRDAIRTLWWALEQCRIEEEGG